VRPPSTKTPVNAVADNKVAFFGYNEVTHPTANTVYNQVVIRLRSSLSDADFGTAFHQSKRGSGSVLFFFVFFFLWHRFNLKRSLKKNKKIEFCPLVFSFNFFFHFHAVEKLGMRFCKFLSIFCCSRNPQDHFKAGVFGTKLMSEEANEGAAIMKFLLKILGNFCL
jgi:hypothetical protein